MTEAPAPFKCPDCDRTFTRAQALGKHRLIHQTKAVAAPAPQPIRKEQHNGSHKIEVHVAFCAGGAVEALKHYALAHSLPWEVLARGVGEILLSS